MLTSWYLLLYSFCDQDFHSIYDEFKVLDTAAYVDTLYAWSAFNTELIGSIVGAALQKLVESYPFDKIHLLGHSLGAHICGTAGRHFHELTQLLLLRITGLDPASKCAFKWPTTPYRLQK